MNIGALTKEELHFIYLSIACAELPGGNFVNREQLEARILEMLQEKFTSVVLSVEA